MRHQFLDVVAHRLAERGVATLRYQFPYMERGSRRPDSPAVAEATFAGRRGGRRHAWRGLPLVWRGGSRWAGA
jgi:predicted alpha/beta-hydrolase family hydrolase